ncbi:MAG: mechanosensitive ion channel domain-containing protein, partial [Pseudomonadota bacterium]
MFDIQDLESYYNQGLANTIELSTSPLFYAQCGLIFMAIVLAFTFAHVLKNYFPILRDEPKPGIFFKFRKTIYQTGDLLFPLLNIALLGLSTDLSIELLSQNWLVKIAQSLAVVFMLFSIINRFISNKLVRRMVTWIAIPIALLHIFGWLDDVTAYLDTIAVKIGNIRISANGIARVIIFGFILFWLGRVLNQIGQQLIRSQEDLDLGTREVFAKLFQVTLSVVIFLLLLQVMGINLTALAVFGGAVGVGLGFGLQAIASNFISGIIILLDRSLTVGDYVELEDGRGGVIRELKMRSTTLETFDGKDIMVPNEQFITSNFVNWTHKNHKQRYSLEFQVAYKTDLRKLFELLREVVASHPDVISGESIPIEERPDAEIAGFGESGVDILVEFWMEGIDDGKNRVGADL